MSQFSFHRPELARSICDSLQGKGITDARSGLFLAAPRRVGKTTFLREDIIPEATSRGWVTVYVDLWENKKAAPELLLADAIKSEIARHEGVITRLARASRLDKISVMGTLSLDFSRPGLPENVTLANALEILRTLARAPVLVIVDEAQHALSSSDGINAMFALKSARDQINASSEAPDLMLVMTGSNRDKLAHLVINKAQPFYGSSVSPFPLLGRPFTDAFAAWANNGLSPDNQFQPDAVFEAFKLVGGRPQMLRDIMGSVALSGEASNLSALLRQGAQEWQDRVWGEFENEFDALSPLQQAILEVLIRKKKTGFSPFSEESMAAYKALIKGETLSPASVQTALDSLRERNLVWREARGAYALEDDGLAEWFLTTRGKTAMDDEQSPQSATPAISETSNLP